MKPFVAVLAAMTMSGVATADDWQYAALTGVGTTSISSEPAQRRILVGTYEGYWFADLETGIWSNRTVPGSLGRQVWVVVGHPEHSDRVVTGRENAWFKGYIEVTDELATDGEVPYTSASGMFTGLARHPAEPDTMYACTWSDINFAEVVLSSDGGLTWGLLSGTLHYQMTDVAIASSGIVYVSGSALVTRSTDGGATWEEAAVGLPPAYGIYTVSAHPTKEGPVLACNDLGLYRSDDSAVSWIQISDDSCRAIARGWPCGGDVDRSQIAIATWDGRVLLSDDSGTTWLDLGGPQGPVDLAFSSTDSSLYVTTENSGVWWMRVCSQLFADGFESGDTSAWGTTPRRPQQKDVEKCGKTADGATSLERQP